MLVVESGKQMYFTHSPDNVVMYASPRLLALLGCRPHAGKRLWTDYLTDNPVNAQGLERTIRAITTGRREPSYRLELAGREGARIWVEVDEIPVIQDGRTVALAGSVIDVTEKKQVDEGIVEAEILLKGSRAEKSGPEATEKSSRRLFRSLFPPSSDDYKEEDVFSGVPSNLW
jgi:PAS domain S-box-containing protein